VGRVAATRFTFFLRAICTMEAQQITYSGFQKRTSPAQSQVGLARALGALSALWGRIAAAGGLQVAHGGDKAIGQDTMWRYWETMSGLALRLSTRDARAALASAFTAGGCDLHSVFFVGSTSVHARRTCCISQRVHCR